MLILKTVQNLLNGERVTVGRLGHFGIVTAIIPTPERDRWTVTFDIIRRADAERVGSDHVVVNSREEFSMV